MKKKLLYFLLITLILTNAAALFMLLKKPHKRHAKPHEFLVKELGFSEDQLFKYKNLSDTHHTNMKAFDVSLKQSKDLLFNSFGKTTINIDSLTSNIGLLEAKKDKEIFIFFSQVKSLCTEKQVEKFDKLIKKAVPKRRGKPPRR